ncbi:hypothetical protein ACRB68_45650 [Actinomadura sp. RB68]|uniref:Tetratricopeptide repeat protein n=1 Tax=Actinomadura macrotermitis TaxID=2585200 RepID=A0A7K0BZ75_9ACTN|nr:hypothetical protein [Actinomadura macrotermitis]
MLLVGDSTAGKTRAAFEAVRAVLPDHRLIVPHTRDAVGAAVTEAAASRRCVLWLNDLEGYLGPDGITGKHVAELLAGDGHHRVIVATLRAAEEDRLTAAAQDDEGRSSRRESAAVLEQARPRIWVECHFSQAEQQRAAEVATDDARINDALAHANTYGIAEYLACGPQLMQEWQRAWARGTHPRGAALVAAAIDIRRAGYTSPQPRQLISQASTVYLEQRGGARLNPETEEQAWQWATQTRDSGNAPLQLNGNDTCEVFDYLLDTVQRTANPNDHIPQATIAAALAHATPADANNIANALHDQGRYQLAETAAHQALNDYQQQYSPEHPRALASRSNLAVALSDLGRWEEAEAEQRAVLEIRNRALGAEHPDVLTGRSNLAVMLSDLGRWEEAEAEQRAVLEIRSRVLGAEHPSTLTSRSNLAVVLRDLGRWEEAEAEQRAVLEIRSRVLGAEHPDILTGRSNLAIVLRDLGRSAEAEAEQRAVLEIRNRVLGAEHPSTLTSRNNLANVLRDLGRSAEAEAEQRAVLEIRSRVLGAEHPDTLDSRNNLAIVLRDQENPQ